MAVLRSLSRSNPPSAPPVAPAPPLLEQLAASYPHASLREVMDALEAAVLTAAGSAALSTSSEAAERLVLALARERLDMLAERSCAARMRAAERR